MRLLKFVFYAIVLLIVGSVFIDFISSVPSITPNGGGGNNNNGWVPYPTENKTTVNVTINDVYIAGLSKSFEVLDVSKSPDILKEVESGGKPFRDAVIEALSRNPNEIKPEQYFYAGDLAGFLKLNATNTTAEYYIINPSKPFYLRIEGALPTNVTVTYPPSAEISVDHTGTGSFEVHYNGYHGERTVRLMSDCGGGTSVVKDTWNWHGTLDLDLPVDDSNCAGGQSFSCNFYVGDTLVLNLDKTYTINRGFKTGHLDYYFKPSCYWRECERDCDTVCDDEGNCHRHCHRHCWWECDPCHDIEKYTWSSEKAPSWAKQELMFEPNPAAEEYLLRAYADAIMNATSNTSETAINEIDSKGYWELYFGKLNREEAKTLMDYFYLVQIPINMWGNDSSNVSRYGAMFTREANHTVISGLYTLLENTTYINATFLNISIQTPFGSKGEKETYVVFALVGNDQNFTKDYLETDCGELAVAELAYYRQPALQGFKEVLKEAFKRTYGYIPDEILLRKGYSPSYGVIYKTDEKVCKIKW